MLVSRAPGIEVTAGETEKAGSSHATRIKMTLRKRMGKFFAFNFIKAYSGYTKLMLRTVPKVFGLVASLNHKNPSMSPERRHWDILRNESYLTVTVTETLHNVFFLAASVHVDVYVPGLLGATMGTVILTWPSAPTLLGRS